MCMYFKVFTRQAIARGLVWVLFQYEAGWEGAAPMNVLWAPPWRAKRVRGVDTVQIGNLHCLVESNLQSR